MNNIFIIPQEEIEIIGRENQIYGYPITSGLKKLTEEIIKIRKYYKIKYITGIDLGCGDGQLIDYFNKNIKKSIWNGIELSNYRISLAKNPINIIKGNLLDISYLDYNFLYINNLVFDDELCKKIEIKIFNEFTGIILLSKPLQYKKLCKQIVNIKNIKVDTNWQKNHVFYFYIFNK
jgi:hypothetical protein